MGIFLSKDPSELILPRRFSLVITLENSPGNHFAYHFQGIIPAVGTIGNGKNGKKISCGFRWKKVSQVNGNIYYDTFFQVSVRHAPNQRTDKYRYKKFGHGSVILMGKIQYLTGRHDSFNNIEIQIRPAFGTKQPYPAFLFGTGILPPV